ncbi:uncharacterized protein [Musca autumnalis]|uniref:uncharacterized protein n=1 Tax=Musca autumnalis TaxID=221902 RepID=UPI003CF42CA7
MLRYLKIINIFLLLIVMQTIKCEEFSAESLDNSANSAEDEEEIISIPQITHDMLMHRNPTIGDNDLKEMWEKLPDYELTDIK